MKRATPVFFVRNELKEITNQVLKIDDCYVDKPVDKSVEKVVNGE